MSSNTWTPAALSSDARSLAGTCWRLVEAQHHVSTLKLVDSVAEQGVLEDLIEASKPPVPSECRDLHYLLSTPFRYGAAYPTGSRFRRAGLTEGVFYSSGNTRDGHRRDGVLSPALLRRVAGYPVARKSGRVHWVLRHIRDQEGNRSDQGQIRRRPGTMDASHRLHSLPNVCRCRPCS